MKLRCFLLSLLLHVSVIAIGNTEPKSIRKASVQDPVQEIRKEYQKIADGIKNQSFAVKKQVIDCDGEVIIIHRYYDFNRIAMLEFDYSSEHSGEISQYFFACDELFFVFTRRSSSFDDVDEKGNYLHKASFSEERIYLRDHTVIRHLRKEYRDREEAENAPNIPVEHTVGFSYDKLNEVATLITLEAGC